MNFINFKTTLFLLCLTILFACNQQKTVDVSAIDVKINVLRFDKDFAKLQPQQLNTQLPILQKKYGAFYKDYFEKVLNVGSVADTNYYTTVREIIKGQAFLDLQHETDSVYKNLDNVTQDLEQAYKHIKYYYPQTKVPKIIAYISGFQVQTPIGSGYVGIGLDMFLGANSKFYPALVQSVPNYISKRFTPDNIAPRVVEVLAREDMFPALNKDRTLLAKMIYNGKIMYFMDKVCPNLADSTKIGLTTKQLTWANTNQADIWGFFLEENLLFDTDYFKTQRYLSEAPFTPGIGSQNESAPKLGIFIGWQIVKKYMTENPDVTLQQLMLERDEQKVLRLAKYHPKTIEN
ncbi:MAG: gliding motility lipoprotein GldB [Sphingobacteriales bacterium]|nr:MAG: gliding motility lipoprotein GldB [Sphingobacteriales bacterium]